MALPLKGGNAIVDESFIQFINDRVKGAKVTCKYCQKELDKNASRLRDHLNGCRNYQEAVTSVQTSAALRALIALAQPQITTIFRTSPQKKAEHWARAAKAVHMTNRPFSDCENTSVATHLHGLDPFYKAPSHGALVGY